MATKAFDAKAFLVNHSEKMVLSAAGLMVLVFLAGSQWSSYKGTPSEITDKVSKSRAALVGHAWPKEEQDLFEMTQKKTPKQVVHDNLRNPISLSQYEMSTRFISSPWQGKEPLREPVFMALEDAIATGGKVLIERPFDLTKVDAETPGTDPEKKPTEPEEFDEFESSRPNPLTEPGMEVTPGFPTSPPPIGGHAATPAGGRPTGGRPPGKKGPATSPNSPPPMMAHDGISPIGNPYGDMMMGEGTMAGPEREAQGYYFTSVRAVFPLKEQIRKYQEAIHAKTFDIAAMSFDVIDFQLERQELADKSGTWSEWQPVDTQSAVDVLEQSMAPEPDIVSGTVTNNVITMPLPPLIFGNWRKHGSHPKIENFELTDEQVQQEVEYQNKLLEMLRDTKKKTEVRPPTQRKGFSSIVGDSRSLQSEVMGGAAYGSMISPIMGGGSPMSVMHGSPAGMGGRGMPRAMSGMTSPTQGPAGITPEVMKKLLETDDKDETSKALKEYIEQRVTADGELLLFRYMDFTVESGKTYRYRVRLVLNNPNFGHLASEADGEAPVVEGETRTTEWSNVTAPVTLERDVHYFVKDVDTRSGKTKIALYQWDSKLGTTITADLDLYPGQRITGSVKTNVIDPAKSTNEDEKLYEFKSSDVFVDTHADVSLDRVLHKDLKLPGGSKGDALLPEEVLVVEAHSGELAVLDPVRQLAEQKRLETYQKKQNEHFEYLKASAAADAEMMMMGSSMDEMYDPYAMSGAKKGSKARSGRARNPLAGGGMMTPGMPMPGGGGHGGAPAKGRPSRGP